MHEQKKDKVSAAQVHLEDAKKQWEGANCCKNSKSAPFLRFAPVW